MRELELLAPAKNTDIGIAAVDCGADAVYMAGPAFGARQAAGNPVSEVKRLCDYAHKFGVRVFVTVNTILFEDEKHGDEVRRAYEMMLECQDAGADGFIVQDLAISAFRDGLGGGRGITVPLHASTQCAIRTPEKAAFLQSLGYGRLVLERQMSLSDIRAIRKATDCELEFFVHGALCESYSGQCYMSEYLTGRSANRGECVQACRSRYDLIDSSGRFIRRNLALLSLKDYNLVGRLEALADSGVSSFKIEGRLKNISYVRNVVRAYSMALDSIVEKRPGDFVRSSFGKVARGFTPDLGKTFNRGYTELFIEGERGKWASCDTPKGVGEEIGIVKSVRDVGRGKMEITVGNPIPGLELSNGDGFSVIGKGEIEGFRAEVCYVLTMLSRHVKGVSAGQRLFRNFNVKAERNMDSNPCVREIGVKVRVKAYLQGNEIIVEASAESEDGRKAAMTCAAKEAASDVERMKSLFSGQMSKRAGHYHFQLERLECADGDFSMPYLGAAEINGIRRSLAEKLDENPCASRPLYKGSVSQMQAPRKKLTYKDNISNSLAEKVLRDRGVSEISPAYEISRPKGAALMVSKYCIRYELGLCPRYQGAKDGGKLFLLNNGRKFPLAFDCAKCEMSVMAPE